SMQANWDGIWSDPVNLSVIGKFNNIGMNSFKSLPAFSGVSGSINAGKKSGTLEISSQQFGFDLPDLFQEPMLFDNFTGNVSWESLSNNDPIKIELNNISFENDHFSGGAHGTYHVEHDGLGEIDLLGYLTRGDASSIGNYLPILDKFPHGWLSRSIVSGELSDVKIILKGNLGSFPFRNNKHGIFQVSMKAINGVLDYIPAWPKITDISADLLFKGSSMEINASQASLSGTNLSRVKVRIPDMMAPDVKLQISGSASGATKKFLKFSAEHVVDIFTPDEINSFNISGDGELLLDLSIPLPYSGVIRVAGSYLFDDNRVDPGLYIPNLEKINGFLKFTESSIETEELRAQIFGGEAAINATTLKGGGISLAAIGEIDIDNLLRFNQNKSTDATRFWTKYIRGRTDWNAAVKIEDKVDKKQASILIESSLKGIILDFPEPFSKIETDIVPLQLVSNVADLNQNLMKIKYGEKIAAKILYFYDDSGDYQIKKGLISVGSESSKLPKSGMLLAGGLPKLQLDKWLSLLDQFNSFSKTDEGNGIGLGLSKIDLNIGVLDFLGRRFNDLTLNASFKNGEWDSDISSKDISGKVNLYSQNKGKIVGRFKKLTMPSVYPTGLMVVKKEQSKKILPALDIVIDNFVFDSKNLGKLKLIANQRDEGWRIEELNVTNKDSSFIADGLWRNYSISPRIDMNIKLESSNLNKSLTRFGYPDRIKRGRGRLEGNLSWLGGPQEISYKTLSGKVKIKAKNGQFPEFDLGIGQLFGIFDLRALPRRVFLDFRDVFSDGFGFDKVSGNASILEGIISTDNLRIRGSAADVEMDGEVDLLSETVKLHFIVTPSL
ncbi:MAG: TIGR02099 family protein, partial [Gammaproteobacteria bacterium]|nr:TIGR02099 family protein [Gammaproteobacteria bacterium]